MLNDKEVFDRIKRMMDSGKLSPAWVGEPEDGFISVGYLGESNGINVEIVVQMPVGPTPDRGDSMDLCESRYLRVA